MALVLLPVQSEAAAATVKEQVIIILGDHVQVLTAPPDGMGETVMVLAVQTTQPGQSRAVVAAVGIMLQTELLGPGAMSNSGIYYEHNT